MIITIYSTTTCPYCKMIKDYFVEKNITFSEKLVDIDDAARTEMMTNSGGFLGVPFTTIALDTGKKETILGFDKGRINTILGIT